MPPDLCCVHHHWFTKASDCLLSSQIILCHRIYTVLIQWLLAGVLCLVLPQHCLVQEPFSKSTSPQWSVGAFCYCEQVIIHNNTPTMLRVVFSNVVYQ